MGLGAGTVERVVAMWERWEREPRPEDIPGVHVVHVAGRTFVTAPRTLRARLDDPPDDLDALVVMLGDAVDRVVGDARLAYGDAGTLRLAADDGTEAVRDDDPRLAALERDADQAEWLESSSDEPCEQRIGIADTRGLAAIASLQVWHGGVGHFGVFTRADCRGRGLGGQVVSPLIARALDEGCVAQWRSLVTNVPSCRVADHLGFETLGHQMVIRVHAS
jgi:RimJ/RimL family protein N-acetyltransferase